MARMQTDTWSPVLMRSTVTVVASTIRPHVRRTPVVDLEPELLGLSCGPVTVKLELLQHSGSFKVRGAFANMVLRSAPVCGVVAASGGNHGAAVAFAARQCGIPAKIFVPRVSSPAKVERIRSYGADLAVVGDSIADALRASREWAESTGAMSIHPFDQHETILGQATLGVELEEER